MTLPSGRLREPLDAAAAADAAVFLEAGSDPAHESAGSTGVAGVFRPGIPVWRARRTQSAATTTEPVLAVAGIASPASFFADLRSNGWRVAAELPFRDHHRYSAADVARIAERGRAAGAACVVTTEKDLVRLLSFRPFPLPIEAVPLTIAIDGRPSFVDWLLSVVTRARS